MIDLKKFPRCCPTRQYVMLGIIRLDNGAIWEIYECQECGHKAKMFFSYTENIEVLER